MFSFRPTRSVQIIRINAYCTKNVPPSYSPLALFLSYQISMSVQQSHVLVTKTLIVPTMRVLIAVLVNKDSLEMDQVVKVQYHFLTPELRLCARASCRYDVENGTRSLARSLDWSIPVNFFSILGF